MEFNRIDTLRFRLMAAKDVVDTIGRLAAAGNRPDITDEMIQGGYAYVEWMEKELAARKETPLWTDAAIRALLDKLALAEEIASKAVVTEFLTR